MEKKKKVKKPQKEAKKENSKEISKEEKEPETLEQVLEEPEQESISRQINLTLSSGQTQTAPIWQEKPIENLEQSIGEIPSQNIEPETPEETYKPNTIQENKSYDFETGVEVKQRGRNEIMETQLISPPSLSSGKQFSEGVRSARMMQSAEMQQTPMEIDEEEGRLYNPKRAPDKEREMSAFNQTAEDIVRKYK